MNVTRILVLACAVTASRAEAQAKARTAASASAAEKANRRPDVERRLPQLERDLWDFGWEPPLREATGEMRPVTIDGVKASALSIEASRKVSDFIVDGQEVFAFTNRKALDEWLVSRGYAAAMATIDQRTELIREQLRRMSQSEREQALGVNNARVLGQSVLLEPPAERAVQTESRTEALAAADLAELFKHCGYQGYRLVLAPNSTLPFLSIWSGMNDAISSVRIRRLTFTSSVALWEHPFYRGRRIVILSGGVGTTTGVSCLAGAPYYFNDKASAVMFSMWHQGPATLR